MRTKVLMRDEGNVIVNATHDLGSTRLFSFLDEIRKRARHVHADAAPKTKNIPIVIHKSRRFEVECC
ncbi:hypothetical protein KCU66_g13, partial [Aureobasidium melanogenum]